MDGRGLPGPKRQSQLRRIFSGTLSRPVMRYFGLLLAQLLAHFSQFPGRQMVGCWRHVVSLGAMQARLPVGLQGRSQIGAPLLTSGLALSIGTRGLHGLRERTGAGQPDGCKQQIGVHGERITCGADTGCFHFSTPLRLQYDICNSVSGMRRKRQSNATKACKIGSVTYSRENTV